MTELKRRLCQLELLKHCKFEKESTPQHMEMFDCVEVTLDFAGCARRARLHQTETSACASLKHLILVVVIVASAVDSRRNVTKKHFSAISVDGAALKTRHGLYAHKFLATISCVPQASHQHLMLLYDSLRPLSNNQECRSYPSVCFRPNLTGDIEINLTKRTRVRYHIPCGRHARAS